MTVVDGDADDPEVNVHSEDGDVQVEAESELNDLKVTVHESISISSDLTDAEVVPSDENF